MTSDLLKDGQIKAVYEAWPCFTTRSQALHKLVTEKLNGKFPGQDVHFETSCHEGGVSFVLRASKNRSRPEGCADEFIPYRLFFDLKEPHHMAPPTLKLSKPIKPARKARK